LMLYRALVPVLAAGKAAPTIVGTAAVE
jgi:hypothetical protein